MDESTKNKAFASYLLVILSALSVLAPAGYLVGTSYYSGRLHGFGINPDLFPLTIQDTYVSAYYALVVMAVDVYILVDEMIRFLFEYPGVFFLAGIVVVATVAALLIVYRESYSSNKWLLLFSNFAMRFNARNDKKIKAAILSCKMIYGLTTMIAIPILILVTIIFLPIVPFQRGTDVSKAEIEKYYKHGCYYPEGKSWGNCKQLISDHGALIYSGLLVAVSAEYVAFFDGEGTRISRMPPAATIKVLYKTEDTVD